MHTLLLNGFLPRRILSSTLVLLLAFLSGLGIAGPSVPGSTAHAQGRDIIFIRDTEIENTIRYYLQPIYDAAGVDASTVKIHLIRDDRLNAFVANGQRIFVHTGLLMKADKPEQVIGVLAHELGHITGGHLSQFKENIENAQAQAIAGMLIGIGAALATGESQAAAAGTALGRQLGERSFLQYTRANEQAADQAAVTYLDAAGISSIGLKEFMELLHQQDRLYSEGANPYTRTHPLSADRITFLENHVANSAATANELHYTYPLVHGRMKAKLVGYLSPQQTIANFPMSDTSAAARYARSIAFMEMARTEEALVDIDALLEASPEDPFYWETKGDIFRRAGRLSDAAEAYREAIRILPWAALIRTSLAQVLIEQNSPDLLQEALENATVAVGYEPDLMRAWTLKGTAHQRRGEIGMVALTQAEVALRRNQKDIAARHAERAMELLPEGSASWLQAQDISYRADG